ncbi:unnamed protein product [Owenia fusiformis]|uniref:Uncharacterized protein n=1 Tax=Owenia fusiformis TaxID=6347 RepID=A0A8J1TL74_OWEFU|nr:unnamed protein product [Owenia fusiformis]
MTPFTRAVFLTVTLAILCEVSGSKEVSKRQSENGVEFDPSSPEFLAEVKKCKKVINEFLKERCLNLTFSVAYGQATRDTLAKVFDDTKRFIDSKIETVGDQRIQSAAGVELCDEWLADPKNDKPVRPTGLEPCPCTIVQAKKDPRFRRDPFCWNNETFVAPRCKNIQPGAVHCVLQRRPSFATGAGQKCCYDKDGELYQGPIGGGHRVKAHLDGYGNLPYYAVLVSYYKLDVLPWLYCCKWAQHNDPSKCEAYYERRPSDDCTGYNGTIPEPPEGGWQPGSYWAGVWGDPHLLFDVGPKDNKFSICFEWFGDAGEIYQYYTETSTGTQVNAKFAGAPWMEQKHSGNAELFVSGGSGKIVGELAIVTKEVTFHIFPTYIVIDGMRRISPWQTLYHQWGSPEDTQVTLNMVDRTRMEVEIQKGSAIIRIMVVRSGKHIDFSCENENEMPGTEGGLMGSIVKSVEGVIPQPSNPEYGNLVVGEEKTHVRARLIEEHGRQCWHVPYGGRDLLAAEHVKRFLLSCIFCDK